jgi:hypothetical protein
MADYRQPVVHVMRRVLRRRAEGEEGTPMDYMLLAEWLDNCPEQQCSPARECAHGPAEAGEYHPPPYKRPTLGGLW